MKYLKILSLMFFVWMLLLSIRPLKDLDVWWHISAGGWIVDNASIPAGVDPFSIAAVGGRLPKLNGMSTQWLGEVVFYAIYLVGGLAGVSILRSLLLVLPFMIIYFALIRKGYNPIEAVSLVATPILILVVNMNYAFERPQAFSFIMSLALVLILLKYKSHSSGYGLLLLLPMMTVWANLHGAYTIGCLIIVLFMSSEALRAAFRLQGAMEKRKLLFMLCICTLAILASFINPNTYRLLYSLTIGRLFSAGAQSGGAQYISAEWLSLWSFWQTFRTEFWPPYAVTYIGLCLSGVLYLWIKARKIDFTEALMAVFSAFVGLSMSRGIMFSFVLLPLFLSDLGPKARKVFAALALVLAVVWVSVSMRYEFSFVPKIPKTWVDQRFPVNTVEFIRDNGIKGNMFNYREWGGFMIFNGFKTFTDTRVTNMDAYAAHDDIMLGRKGWRKRLDYYGIDFIVTPVVVPLENYVPPLVVFLSDKDSVDWVPVYYSPEENSLVFVRNEEKFRHLIESSTVKRWIIYKDMLIWAESMLRIIPDDATLVSLRDEALKRMKEFPEGKEFAKVLKGELPLLHHY